VDLFAEYARHGWSLCLVPTGHKGPLMKGWQQRANAITDPAVARELIGCGLLHAYSGTCVLDIDDFTAATAWCAAQGIDLDALWNDPAAVKISSGRPNRGKLLYALSTPLPSKKIVEKGGAADGLDLSIIDFRCGTRSGVSVQDVLPGTIHPGTGKPYEWVFEPMVTDWRTPPELPANVRTVWTLLVAAGLESDAQAPPAPVGASAEKLRAVLARKDPDCDRDSWVKVLSQLHHETKGSDDGLALANEWSARGSKYDGFEDVRTRWRSFTLGRPGSATMDRDINSLPATAEEFPPIAPEPAKTAQQTEAEAAQRRTENKAAKKMAIETLEKTLVFTAALDRYFDTEKRIALASDHAIRHLYTGKMPYIRTQTGRAKADPVNVLKDSDTKRVVDMPGFHPGAGLFFTEDGIRYVNEYVADSVQPLKPTEQELAKIEWLFARIDETVFRDWLRQFYGHAVQKPGVKIFSAPLIWSEMTGNGKSTLLQEIPQLLFGQRYSTSVSNSQLASEFNDYLIGKWFVHLSELHANAKNERDAIAGKLKAWITDPLSLNVKGSRGYTTRNSLVITAASNKADAATIENNDRRWAVYEMSAPRFTKAEGVWLHDEFLKTPRAAGVLRHYFLNVDLTGFVPTAPAPETRARAEMIAASMSQDVAVIHEAIADSHGPFVLDIVSPHQIIEYLRQQGVRTVPTANRLGRILSASPLNCVQIRPDAGRGNGTKLRLWVCRNQESWVDASAKVITNYWSGDASALTG
jgi:hypothetical protein